VRPVDILKVVGKRNTTDESPQRGESGHSFGARLRGLRQAAGLTQEELALRAGLSPNAVSALERGARKRPQPHTVRSLSEALGLSEEGRTALLASVPKRGVPGSSGAQEDSPASPAASVLPRPATPLVGRERELAEVRGLLTQRGIRLLTFTGIGGVGKTRLAVEVAREGAKTSRTGRRSLG
jgi:transcriptional regulator with XRE-family HTH domain